MQTKEKVESLKQSKGKISLERTSLNWMLTSQKDIDRKFWNDISKEKKITKRFIYIVKHPFYK